MKKYKSRSTFFKLSIPFILLLAVIIHSCRKDIKHVPQADVAIEQARQWYESTYQVKASNINGALVTQASGEHQDLSQWVKPDWQHTSKYKRLGKDVIEMPVDPSSKFASAIQLGSWLTNKSYSRNYFLLLNDGKKYEAYLMMVVADSDYVKNDTSKLSHNTYLKNDPDFSGKVIYLTPKGDYVGGFAYRNGQLVTPTSVVQQTGGPKVQSTDGPVLKPDKMVQQCTDWYLDYYIDGIFDHSVYIGRTCVTVDDGTGTANPAGGDSPPAPCAPPAPPIQSSINGSHLAINFVPPPSPCTPVPPKVKDTILTDPCSAAKTAAGTSTNNITTNNSSVNSAFNSAIGFGNNGKEAAFHVDKVGSTFSASTPVATNEGAAFSSTNYNTNTIAIGHSHDATSFPTPSPYDIYQLGELAVVHSSIKTDLVVSPSAKYSLVVADVNAFKAFFAKYDESNLKKDAGQFTGDFDSSKPLGAAIENVGIDAKTAYLASHAVNPSNPTAAENIAAEIAAEEASLVFFVSNYNTGIALLKADSTGVFKPLHFTSATVNGVTIYTVSPCNQD